MSRTPPSTADLQLIAYAADLGVEVRPRQLERWRSRPDPLLPGNPRSYPGRVAGGGSASAADPSVGDLVVWLGRNQRPGGSRENLALGAFGAGLPVPETTVRAVLARQVSGLGRGLMTDLGPLRDGQELDDWIGDGADRFASRGAHRVTVVVRRIQKINKALRAMPALAPLWEYAQGFDAGAGAEHLDSAGVMFHAAMGIAQGADGVSRETIGRAARSHLGSNMPNPGAYLIENNEDDPLAALRHQPTHQLPGLPESSILNHIYSLALDAPLDDLHAAWTAAGSIAPWADRLCTAVEAEIAIGEPGEAAREWTMGVLVGFTTLLLREGLLEPDPTPSQQAASALGLLFQARGVNEALAAADADGRERAALLAPPFLRPLLAL
ncbi:hypothetical protein [Kitasatospora sp. DSM 101779]|uniref:hypothetical protein n=1 Tax=Kitasatospora sp. DSM 101779 TaxID=2853165 RepID=UPI0021DA33D3|nr:hypothetical protein [Kitasatospora sp. DSM 101779]MCU7822187.1 hypothetical protein [Kitasatospora sp. DSM 101779]